MQAQQTKFLSNKKAQVNAGNAASLHINRQNRHHVVMSYSAKLILIDVNSAKLILL